MEHTRSLDIAVIGNCRIAALVDAIAGVVWMCWPRPDADPVFCALLEPRPAGADRGALQVRVRDPVRFSQQYLRNTAVLETIISDSDGGEVAVTDFCPRFRTYGRMFRPPTLIRRVEPRQGRPIVTISLRPACDYGARDPAVVVGSDHLRFCGNGSPLRVTTDGSLSHLQEGQEFVLDRTVSLVLGADEAVPQQPGLLAAEWLAATVDYWRDWVRTLALPRDWQQAVIRAAITLKLCTYEDTGAVLAALTTSIPESPAAGRTWDYRYCWLRDAFFVIQALNRLGATRTMEGFLTFIKNVASLTDDGLLRPAYRVAGTESLEEQIAPALAGYRGHGPVRIGNAAATQRQHDVYGAVVLATAQLFNDERLAIPGDVSLFATLETLGSTAVRLFGQPDAGPWEIRGIERPHTYSAMMCWAACDRLARAASTLGLADRAEHWTGVASRLREELLRRAWSERQAAFVSTLDGDGHIDATSLLMPELGLLAPGDERFQATLAAVERELVVQGYVMRYRHADDFGVPTSAFLACTFWYVNCLAMVGRRGKAVELFETLLAHRNHVGLLSEDIDPRTGELWGNLPQTYSLVGAITSAIRLSRPWEHA